MLGPVLVLLVLLGPPLALRTELLQGTCKIGPNEHHQHHHVLLLTCYSLPMSLHLRCHLCRPRLPCLPLCTHMYLHH